MSRSFTGTNTNRVQTTQYAAINSLSTLTLSIWAKQNSTSETYGPRLLDKLAAGGNGTGAFIWLIDNAASTVVFASFLWSGGQGRWNIPYTPGTTAWHHHAVTYSHSATTNDAVLYLDGVSGLVTDVFTPVGTVGSETQDLTVGNRPAGDRAMAGGLGHAAAWNVELTAAEVAQLAKGIHPYEIRPANLVFYMPLWGDASPEPNVASPANTGAVTGTVKFEEPPVGDFDTAIVQLTDAAALLNSFSVTAESSRIGLTESALTVVASLVSSESATVQVTENTTFANETAGNDTGVVQCSEGALSVPTTEQRTADSSRVGLTETAQVAVFANGEDTVSPAVLEAEAFVSAIVSLAASLGCGLEEAADLVTSWTVSESVIVQVDEAITIGDAPIPVSLTDACLVGCEDTIAVASSQSHPRAGRTLREMIKPGHFQIRDYSEDSDRW